MNHHNLTPAWAMALYGWETCMRFHGRPEKLIKLRLAHVRSVATLSRTNHPSALTHTCLSDIYRDQQWASGYVDDVRQSMDYFWDWWRKCR